MKDTLKKILKSVWTLFIKLLMLGMSIFFKMLNRKPKLTLSILFIVMFLLLQNSQAEIYRQNKLISEHQSQQTSTSAEIQPKQTKPIPDNFVKVPNTFFKTKEHVQAFFEHAGLKLNLFLRILMMLLI